MGRRVEVVFSSGCEVLARHRGPRGTTTAGGMVIAPEDGDGGPAWPEGTSFQLGHRVALVVRVRALKQVFRVATRVAGMAADVRGPTRLHLVFSSELESQPLLHAAWSDAHGTPQRKHTRQASGAPVRYVSAPDAPALGELVDVSRGGCRIKGPLALRAGARVAIALVAGEAPGGVPGLVRWVSPAGDAGIEFSRLLDEVPAPPGGATGPRGA